MKHGAAVRAVRRVREVTSAMLLQSDLDERWWAENLKLVTGVPWERAPSDDRARCRAWACRSPIRKARSEDQTCGKESTSRGGIHLRKKDFEVFGRTVGCKGYLAKMRGALHAILSEAFRTRMPKEMQATEDGRRITREAGTAGMFAENVKQKRFRRDEIMEAGIFKRESAFVRLCGVGGGDDKGMHVEEEGEIQPGSAYEQVDDGVERARRMEAHEDDDEGMLMELACTDDFEEYREIVIEKGGGGGGGGGGQECGRKDLVGRRN